MNNPELASPDPNTWQPGNIETGPIPLDMLAERDQMAEQLAPVVHEAYQQQFGFESQRRAPSEVEAQRETRLTGEGVDFLADAIQFVADSDRTEDEKRRTINTLMETVVSGNYEGREFDRTYTPFEAEGVSVTHNTTDPNEATMFGMGALDPKEKIKRRIGLAKLYLEDSETADHLMESNTIGMHGTTSGALEGILDEGLRPAADMIGEGKQLATGERRFNGAEGQPTVSLIDFHRADWLKRYTGDGEPITPAILDQRIESRQAVADKLLKSDDSEVRAKANSPDNNDMQGELALIEQLKATKAMLESSDTPAEQKRLIQENYPVIVAVDESALYKNEVPRPSEYVEGEFVLEHDVPAESMTTLLVPADKISEVQAMCAERGLAKVRVRDIEVYRRAFKEPAKPRHQPVAA